VVAEGRNDRVAGGFGVHQDLDGVGRELELAE
jgi:hypothetical protein